MRSFLLLLYKPILVPVLSEWIEYADLCCLDTSYCHTVQRKDFLSILSSISLTYSTADINRLAFYEWVELRGLIVKNLSLSISDFQNPTIQSVLSRSQRLKYLESPDCPALLQLFVNGLRVDSLSLSDSKDSTRLFSYLGTLQGLSVEDCNSLTVDFLRKISVHCLNLKALVLPKGHNMRDQRVVIRETLYLSNIQKVGRFDLSMLFNSPEVKILRYCPFYGDLLRTNAPDAASIKIGDTFFNITQVTVSHTTPEIFAPLVPHLKHVESLVFYGYDYSVFSSIRTQCFSLILLSVYWIPIDDPLIDLIKQNSMLKEARFHRTRGRGSEVLTALAEHCPMLESVTMDGREIVEQDLKILFKNCVLMRRMVTGNYRMQPTNTMIRQLACGLYSLKLYGSCGEIEIDSVRGGKQLTICGERISGYFSFPFVFSRNPLLTRIDFEHIRQLTDYKLGQLIDLCPQLNYVRLSYCNGFTVDGLKHFSRCKKLTEFIAENLLISDEIVRDLLVNKPFFENLSLDDCTGYTGDVVHTIVECCPGIRSVNFAHNKIIASADIITLLQGCPRLHMLRIRGCSLVDSTILPYFKNKMMNVSLTSTAIPQSDIEEHIATHGLFKSCW